MEKITVNTKAQLDELEKGSALTFIGCVNTDEEDVRREDEDNVQLGDEIRYEIEWKDLWG